MAFISRKELHTLVWQTPLIHIAPGFGITGTRLAKICKELDVPYPPSGYWTKKFLGKTVVTQKPPIRKEDIPEQIDIKPRPKKLRHKAKVNKVNETTGHTDKTTPEIQVPDTLHHLHPMIRSWTERHKQEQKNRRKDAHNSWSWRPTLYQI